MKILLVTDAWIPQVNGVVTTLENLVKKLSIDHDVKIIEPNNFVSVPIPFYKEIKLSLNVFKIKKIINDFRPDLIHIATEGPLGLYARKVCLMKKIKFSSSYHTNYPLYLKKMLGVPVQFTNRFERWFHNAACVTFVNTPSHKKELEEIGIKKLALWSRGIDENIFFPTPNDRNNSYYLYVGRVSKEKNLESFLSLELDKKKVVVGDGPSLKSLKKKYPDVEFLGYKFGRELAEIYSNACVKVFPSRTDTFGIVMIEANACGTPVAGYPVTGPIDVVKNGENGYLNKDLYQAIKKAQKIDPKSCIAYSKKYSWDEVASNFISTVTTAYL
jgi:glycosyltransferase involved in cell wall biosynthesis